MNRQNGIVRTFNEQKGFGFLRITFKEQFFFHVTEWESDTLPVPGQRVSFEVRPTTKPNGLPLAANIRPVDKAADLLATGLPAETVEPTATSDVTEAV